MSGFNVKNYISGEVIAHFATKRQAHHFANSQPIGLAMALIIVPA